MSYDLYIAKPGMELDHIDCRISSSGIEHCCYEQCNGIYCNMTYNASRLLSYLHCNPKQNMDSHKAKDVAGMVSTAFCICNNIGMDELKQEYDKDSPYGSLTERTMAWLSNILSYCTLHPDYDVMERS